MLTGWVFLNFFKHCPKEDIAIGRNKMKILKNFSTTRSITLWFALILSLMLVGFNILRWTLADDLTPYGVLIVALVVNALFIINLLWSILFFIRHRKSENKRRAITPLTCNLVTIAIAILIPFNSLIVKYDFKMYLREREKVIQLVEQQELKPNVAYNNKLILLPLPYRHLSKGGGEIIVEGHPPDISIFFYTYRGMLDNFSGFIYKPGNEEPSNSDFGGDFKEIKKIKGHWFFAASW